MAAVPFYKIGHDRRDFWTWAWRLQPSLHEITVPCDVCGNGRLYPGRYPERPFDAEVEGGNSYSDILGCGATPLLIVSEAVVRDWQAHNVTGYQKFPLTVVKATGPEIEKQEPPQYYHIQVTGRCQLDLDAMGIRITFLCPKCGYIQEELLEEGSDEDEAAPFGLFPFILREDTWDGSDLFASDLYPRVTFCSQKVFDLAGMYRRTGFSFTLPEEAHRVDVPGIDYLAAAESKYIALITNTQE